LRSTYQRNLFVDDECNLQFTPHGKPRSTEVIPPK
jgi:hypothetical protein